MKRNYANYSLTVSTEKEEDDFNLLLLSTYMNELVQKVIDSIEKEFPVVVDYDFNISVVNYKDNNSG